MKLAIIMLVLAIIIAGCASPKIDGQVNISIEAKPALSSCADEECLVKAANNCESIEVTLKQPGGTFRYSSEGCVIRKTLESLNSSENPEIRRALEGKSLNCAYKKGEFDTRWINSLLFGLEYCKGELKDALAWLLMLL